MYCSMFVFLLLCWVCIQRTRFMCILQVFFSILSVSLWQNYSATYWSGMYTTSFWVSFCGFMCTQIFLWDNAVFMEERRKKGSDIESSCFVWMSPEAKLKLVRTVVVRFRQVIHALMLSPNFHKPFLHLRCPMDLYGSLFCGSTLAIVKVLM